MFGLRKGLYFFSGSSGFHGSHVWVSEDMKVFSEKKKPNTCNRENSKRKKAATTSSWEKKHKKNWQKTTNKWQTKWSTTIKQQKHDIQKIVRHKNNNNERQHDSGNLLVITCVWLHVSTSLQHSTALVVLVGSAPLFSPLPRTSSARHPTPGSGGVILGSFRLAKKGSNCVRRTGASFHVYIKIHHIHIK